MQAVKKVPSNYETPRTPRSVPLVFANIGLGELLAGPYRAGPSLDDDVYRIKLAAEIDMDSDISVPISDFGVPEPGPFYTALYAAAKQLLAGNAVFAGCMGGIGRTGTFLAALFKLHHKTLDYLGVGRVNKPLNVVDEVRHLYYRGAVETRDQENFVRDLQLNGMARRLAFQIRPTAVFTRAFWQD